VRASSKSLLRLEPLRPHGARIKARLLDHAEPMPVFNRKYLGWHGTRRKTVPQHLARLDQARQLNQCAVRRNVKRRV